MFLKIIKASLTFKNKKKKTKELKNPGFMKMGNNANNNLLFLKGLKNALKIQNYYRLKIRRIPIPFSSSQLTILFKQMISIKNQVKL